MKVSKSELVRRAVNAYQSNLEREHLKIAMQKASYRVRRLDPDVSEDLDSLVSDGLDDA
jgi:Arc/MetJ-type ribon-helix-helix transcriptional regulator